MWPSWRAGAAVSFSSEFIDEVGGGAEAGGYRGKELLSGGKAEAFGQVPMDSPIKFMELDDVVIELWMFERVTHDP